MAPYRDGGDKLEFIVSDTGSQIDLSGLRIINTAGSGRVEFQINTGGRLLLGDLVQTTNTVFRVQDMSSSLEVAGSLNLSASSELHVAPLGRVAVTRSLLFAQTDETKIDLDEALLHMNGIGPQYLELGGEDLGLPSGPGGSGNFGIGQLVLGGSGASTSASLIDLYDNGNRGTVGAEALYLYGLGGMEGLLIEGGSVVTLNNLNVYAWNTAAGAMQHLNALFEPGEMRIPFDNGYLQLARMDVEWTNAAGATFATGGNWDKGMPPAGSDSALWNQGSSEGYTVDFANSAASDAAVIKNDTVTFDLAGHEYSLGGIESSYAIVVGQAATDQGSLTIENGTLQGRNLLIGGAGATGELGSGRGCGRARAGSHDSPARCGFVARSGAAPPPTVARADFLEQIPASAALPYGGPPIFFATGSLLHLECFDSRMGVGLHSTVACNQTQSGLECIGR